MSDTFMEYLIKKRSTPRDLLLKVLIILTGIALVFALFFLSPLLGFFSMFGYLAIAGAVYGMWYLVTAMNVEFEYVLTNGDIDVDKIIAQRKRKRLVSVKCSSFEELGKYKAAEHQNKTYQTKLMVCSNPEDPEVWYAVFNHAKLGRTLLVFNASEAMLENMKKYLPRQLAFEVFVKRTAQ
ncbi:MAG: hypothetical protein DBX66_03750 [Clostridiales bacterium]|uniref:Uncharacterized protein n=1 Tax=Harryflintia acetispora TaxID=1849041 RepID=A0A9X8UKZ8_9FIRM|nr:MULTISPECIES: DUF6106 family protein [Oscillospiraceae]PWM38479.1 MAG: hypothetical protein DBX66_03750 [Clostridiales bacterium]RGB69791.1 hypothetical protein DW086_01265 [Harryflintia acetispora]TCL44629.1 hypothetical protein EDD78_102255 [Harryflintia acetispora]